MYAISKYLWGFGLCLIALDVLAQDETRSFNIPAQPLVAALEKFTRQGGVHVFYADTMIKDKQSTAVVGNYSAKQALTRLLTGTGIISTFTADNAAALKAAPLIAPKAESPSEATLPAVTVAADAVYDQTDPYNQDYVIHNATAGTKTDTPIMETPLNVQVITKQVLKDQQVINLGDALKNVSGVTTNTAGGTNDFNDQAGSGTNIFLRGFTSQTFFRNGFRLQQGAASREMANVEAVEVLKGPAAILYGLVEPGGMVNVVTKQPQATPYYALNQQFGSYNLYRTTLDATGPIANNKDVLYRVNMSYQNSGSFRDFVGKEDVFFAPVLKWNISPRTQATFQLEYNHQHNGLDVGFVPTTPNGIGFLNTPINRNYGAYSPSITETIFGGFNWSHQFNDDWNIKHRFSVNQQNISFNRFLVPQLAADGNPFQQIFGDTPLQGTGINVLRNAIGENTQYNTYSTNLDLVGHFDTFFLKHTLLVGGDYYRLNTSSRRLEVPTFNEFTFVDAFNPVNPGINVTNPNIALHNPGFLSQSQTDQFGLYAQDQIKLPYGIHVTGGFRYQYIHQNNLSQQPGSSDTSTAQTQDAVTPRVGIMWQPKSWISLYANYAESFGVNNGLAFPSKPLPPTSAEQYEGGIKTQFFDGRLRATFAYYDLTKTNVPTADPNQALICGGSVGSCLVAIGAVRSRGPELDIQGEILPGWNAIATWSNTDIIVTKTNGTNDAIPGVAGGAGGAVNLKAGDRMVNVPRNTASFWTTYEVQESDLKGFKFGGGVTVRDGQSTFGGQDLNGNKLPFVKLPGYTTVGLMAAYSHAVGKAKVTVQFNVDNLLDTHYFTSASRFFIDPSAGLNGAFVGFGTPRTFMGSVSIQY